MQQNRTLRIVDVALCSVLALATVPLLAVTTAFVFLVSGSSLLLRQSRIGLHGEPFELLKLRTMKVDAEQRDQPVIASLDDDRIIWGGRTIRALHLDELPQLINVLRGDMSLVGPRPERPEFVERLRDSLADYDERHRLPPGITGVAQVTGGYYMDPVDKLERDLEYVRHPTPRRYLSVLAATPLAVVRDVFFTHTAQPEQLDRSTRDTVQRPVQLVGSSSGAERSTR